MINPPEKQAALDYHKPPSKIASTGCLSLATAFAIFAGLGTAFGTLFLRYESMVVLAGGTVILVIAGVYGVKKGGMNRALATVIVALCVFGLMFGLCAGFGPVIEGPR